MNLYNLTKNKSIVVPDILLTSESGGQVSLEQIYSFVLERIRVLEELGVEEGDRIEISSPFTPDLVVNIRALEEIKAEVVLSLPGHTFEVEPSYPNTDKAKLL